MWPTGGLQRLRFEQARGRSLRLGREWECAGCPWPSREPQGKGSRQLSCPDISHWGYPCCLCLCIPCCITHWGPQHLDGALGIHLLPLNPPQNSFPGLELPKHCYSLMGCFSIQKKPKSLLKISTDEGSSYSSE